ncbi:MAG: hypothetical protein JXA49_02055 [Actinobacteria bacterium]|nr:hypothetical protein [Actinomycetota bacterium]
MNGINPGDVCIITHDIGTSFRQGEQVVVAQVDPDPQAPQFRYLVQSQADMNWYKLSDQDIVLQQQVEVPAPQMTQVMDLDLPSKRGTNWKTLGISLAVIVLIAVVGLGAMYFLVWNSSSTDEPVVEEPVRSTVPRTVPGTTPSTTPSTTPAPAVTSLGTVKVNQSKFELAQNGMNYSQVVGVFGGPGVERSATGTPGQPGYMIEYVWDGETPGTAVFCTFVDDKLTVKRIAAL